MHNPELLHIRAARTRKTYVGASFCIGESVLRDSCEDMDPLSVIDFNNARRAVQEGESAEVVMAGLVPPEDESGVVSHQRRKAINNSGPKDLGPVIMSCLRTIEAGECTVYPRE